MIPLSQIDQCSVGILAWRIAHEYMKVVGDDDFMERFKEWKAARDAARNEEAAGEGETTWI